MKKFLRSVLVIVSLAFVAFACKKEDAPVLTVSATDKAQSFIAAGESKTVAVSSNGDYTFTSDQSWATVAKVATGITITVTEHTGYDQRTAKVTLSLNGAPSVEIAVTQLGLTPSMIINNGNPVTVEYAGGEVTVPVTASGAYELTLEEGVTWVSVENTATGIKLTVSKNPDNTDRSAKVTARLTGSTTSVEFTVTQMPVVAVEPSSNIVVNTSLGAEKTLSVRTAEGTDYTVTVVDSTGTAPDWVTVEKTSGELKLTIAPRIYYPDPTFAAVSADLPERKATVTISVDGVADATPVTFDVIQGGNLDKKKMEAYYIDGDNTTLWDPVNRPMAALFNNISYMATPTLNRQDFYLTAPNTDGSGDPEKPNELSWTFPFYFTFDLGVSTHLNSFKITPRSNRYSDRRWEYRLGNPYQFAVWGTNEDPKTNPNSFVKLGDFTCEYLGDDINVQVDDVNDDGTPKLNEDGTPVKKWVPEPVTDRSAITPETLTFDKITYEASVKATQGYDFALTPTEGPVRYLRFEIKKVWGTWDVIDPDTKEVIERLPLTYVNIQELWFWGDPAGN